ncbi:MAG TPA: S49 family peptidase [Verrucomicrobiota bacterium]|nr:S49 family peptidase [Verrucomicrobiota bacterium]
MLPYPHLAARLFNTPLLLHPGKLSAIVAGLGPRFGVELAPSAYLAPDNAQRLPGGYRRVQNIGLLDIHGALVHRSQMRADSTYLQGYDDLAARLDAALNDPGVAALILNIDSPGGEVAGAFQFAEHLYQARAQKPIYAIAADLAASAAYLIASAAHSISLSPTAQVGSIGVALAHIDTSRALEKAGLAVTTIYAGAHKLDGNPYQPLPPDVAADLQADVNHYYELFLSTVAQYRPALSTDLARATEARTYIGAQALTEHLADRVETPDALLSRLLTKFSKAPRQGKSMKTEFVPVLLDEAPPVAAPGVLEETAETPHVPDACAPVAVSELCLQANEPGLIPLLLKTPQTPADVEARIAQAKAVRQICALAHQPALAEGLIAAGSSADDAKLITWNALVARDEAAPIQTTPPVSTARALTRAQFDALTPTQRRDALASGVRLID